MSYKILQIPIEFFSNSTSNNDSINVNYFFFKRVNRNDVKLSFHINEDFTTNLAMVEFIDQLQYFMRGNVMTNFRIAIGKLPKHVGGSFPADFINIFRHGNAFVKTNWRNYIKICVCNQQKNHLEGGFIRGLLVSPQFGLDFFIEVNIKATADDTVEFRLEFPVEHVAARAFAATRSHAC